MPNFRINSCHQFVSQSKTVVYNQNQVPANYVNRNSNANINGSKTTGIAVKTNTSAKADYY
jgi:hypothetical protein